VTFELSRAAVPALHGVRELIARGVAAGRAEDNRAAYTGRIAGELTAAEAALLFDPQTSGGLLVALPEAAVARFVAALGEWQLGAVVVGRVTARGAVDLVLG
jgi:selenide,water dikinase